MLAGPLEDARQPQPSADAEPQSLTLTAHVSLTKFDIKMVDGAQGPCIQFNEGQGGGTSSGYFNYWVAARGIKVGETTVGAAGAAPCCAPSHAWACCGLLIKHYQPGLEPRSSPIPHHVQGVAAHSVVQDMRLITCGSHGIKFSTFISDVLVSRVEVAGAFPPDLANISTAPGGFPQAAVVSWACRWWR